MKHASVLVVVCIFILTDNVTSCKKLRGGVKFVSRIPKSLSGKILHSLMRDEMKKAKANMWLLSFHIIRLNL